MDNKDTTSLVSRLWVHVGALFEIRENPRSSAGERVRRSSRRRLQQNASFRVARSQWRMNNSSHQQIRVFKTVEIITIIEEPVPPESRRYVGEVRTTVIQVDGQDVIHNHTQPGLVMTVDVGGEKET